MTDLKNQGEILVDKNSRGKDRNWRGRKVLSLRLADIFKKLQYKDSLVERVATCGDTLRFIRNQDGSLKLYQAYFCKNKLGCKTHCALFWQSDRLFWLFARR